MTRGQRGGAGEEGEGREERAAAALVGEAHFPRPLPALPMAKAPPPPPPRPPALAGHHPLDRPPPSVAPRVGGAHNDGFGGNDLSAALNLAPPSRHRVGGVDANQVVVDMSRLTSPLAV